MNINEALNNLKARLSKATGEIVGKINDLELKLKTAIESQQPISQETIELVEELGVLAQKLDDIVPDAVVDVETATETPAAE